MTKKTIGFESFAKFKKKNNLSTITHFLKQEQKKEEPKAEPEVYPITECLNLIKDKNLAIGATPEIKSLIIERKAYLKLLSFINLIGDYEISGFGRIIPLNAEEKEYKVIDFDILKQEVRGAYVESSDNAVMDFIRRIPADQLKEWTLDWHSHVNMGTTPSTTDWNNYKEMFEARMMKQFPIMIVNKREEITSYQIISKETHEKISVYLEENTNVLTDKEVTDIYNECKEKIQKLCSKYETASSWYTTYKSSNNYGSTSSFHGSNNLKSTLERLSKNKKKEEEEIDDDWGYDYNQYYMGYNPSKYEDEEDDDDEVKELEKKGYVFDSWDNHDTSKYSRVCASCGKELVSDHEKDLGMCEECFQDFNSGY